MPADKWAMGFALRALLGLLLAWSFSCGGGAAGTCESARDCERGQICVSGACQTLDPIVLCTGDDACEADQFCDADGVCKARTGGGLDATVSAPDASPEPDATAGEDAQADAGFDEDAAPGADAVIGADAVVGADALAGADAVAAPDALPGDAGGCTQDNQCGTPPADICDNGRCARGCGVAGGITCGGGNVCDTTTGHCVPVVTTCSADSQCMPAPPARVCESSQCVPGCGQAGGLVCSGSTPQCNTTTGRCEAIPPCTLDSQCMSADQICLNGTCTLRCDRAGAASCGANNVCNTTTGRCIPGNLALGADCTLDAQCQSLLCLGVTIGGMNREICSQPCGASSHCPLDFNCLYLSGMNFCLGEALFNPPATFNVAAPGACMTGNIQCQSGWCNTQLNQCIETCSREQDCAAFGGSCFTYTQAGTTGNSYDHLCLQQAGSPVGNACTTNANCASGVCSRYTNTCAAHCCSDADCPTAQSCGLYDLDVATGEIVKICGPRTPGAGNQPLGATCTDANQCESEICVTRSLSDPMGPSQCSTFCCRHSDCSAFPNGRCEVFGGPTVGPVSTIVGACVNGS